MLGISASLAYKYICKITLACESVCVCVMFESIFLAYISCNLSSKSDLVLKMEFSIHLINENLCLVVHQGIDPR